MVLFKTISGEGFDDQQGGEVFFSKGEGLDILLHELP